MVLACWGSEAPFGGGERVESIGAAETEREEGKGGGGGTMEMEMEMGGEDEDEEGRENTTQQNPGYTIMASIGVGLIGGGIFAKEQHLPAIIKCASLSLKAIYSRSLKSAQDTAALYTEPGPAPELYSGDSDKDRDYDALLRRDDVSAVIIALPIISQPEYIKRALAAGKHVLAEKPLAKDVQTGKELIAYYKDISSSSNATFAVAENFRFTPSFVRAAALARQLGAVTHFSVRSFGLMAQDTKWYGTEWRRKPEYQGGFLLDGGVHQAAATRLLLGADARPSTVSAATRQVQAHLPPIDTVNAVLETASGATGTFQLSCGSTLNTFDWDVACEKGSIKIRGETLTVTQDGKESVEKFERTTGVTEEVAAWAEGLVKGRPNELQSPEEALADLEFLEKMFVSGEQNGAVQKYEYQSW
ncbi:oxidoreductase [Mariannaea sp. PMI_226]|nr:oxidoreductase [Mariannaea sp. PMI_226]